MSKAMLAALGERARAVLKALSEDKKDDAPVPAPPPDPDALPADPRVEGADASPKEKDLDGAGEAQASAQPAQPAPGDEEETDEDGRPIKKGFDEFGNQDIDPEEMRSLMKSYGITPATDEDKIAGGGVDVESILEAILQGLEAQNAAVASLTKEVSRLRSANAENERTIAKALDSLADPRIAPAAPPRAVTKAIADPQTIASGETEAQFANRMFAKVQARQMTEGEARAEIRAFKSR